jgi:hypothetical protein
MAIKNDLMEFGGLMLALFLIAIVVVVTFIGMDYLKSAACTQANSTFVFSNGVCYNDSGAGQVQQTVTAITKANIVEAVIDVALALLTLVVLIGIFQLVIKAAKGFSSGGAGGF